MFIPPHTMQLKTNNTIFLDDGNINNDSGPMISGDQPPLTDPKERERKRERDRYAQLSDQQKDKLLKKRREARQQKKVLQGEQQCTSKQIEARRTNARARYANLTPEQRQTNT